MHDAVIEVRDLSKAYRLGQTAGLERTFRELIYGVPRALVRRLRRAHEAAASDEILWALRGASFDVRRGEVLGIIGANGAGKSTLLKILSEITDPTEGTAVVRGRVASLLEVGTGFHPELTGGENIFLNGAILGMTRREIRRKFDAIVDFAGVKPFIGTPVKRYSSGMRVRLAFAVAAHLDPEILIIDEVLAVGDAAFQDKCLGKMQDITTGEGRTVVFVSHNMAAVQSLCDRALLLHAGQIAAEGDTSEVIEQYMARQARRDDTPVAQRTDRHSDGAARILDCWARGERTDQPGRVDTARPWAIDLEYHIEQPGSHYAIKLGVFDPGGTRVAVMTTDQYADLPGDWPTTGRMRFTFDQPCPLWPGVYTVNAAIMIDGIPRDYVRQAAKFEVVLGPDTPFGGLGRGSSLLLLTGNFDVQPAALSTRMVEDAA